MANFRQESQDLQLINDLINSSFVPKKNDKVFIKETNMMYDFDHLSTLVANGTTIIEQTGYPGRWIAISADVTRSEDVLLSVTLGTRGYLSHFYGENEANVGNYYNEDKIPFYVQVNERSHPFVQDLIDKGLEPKIRLMREPIGRRPAQYGPNYIDNNIAWTIPTHRNEVIPGQKQSSGIQHGATGQPMNEIDTKFDLMANLKDHTQAFIQPLDWFRLAGSQFGNQVLPITEEQWSVDNKVRIRGRKSGKYSGRKKALRFKVCLEWTSPTDSKVKLRSTPSHETITLKPVGGIFGAGGDYPNSVLEFNKYYYRWTLKLK
jgi:hypothetical protein